MLSFALCLEDRGMCSKDSLESALDALKEEFTLYQDTVDTQTADAVAICILKAEGFNVTDDGNLH